MLTMVSYRTIGFERTLENLKRGKYRGRIQAADYANTGIQVFESRKFAEHLGSSEWKLSELGLIKITKQCGWNLPTEPTPEELLSFKDQLT